MTRPPNKRVSRGRPVRTVGAGSKNSGCALVVIPTVALLVALLWLLAATR